MFAPVKTLIVAAALMLAPYAGGASDFAQVAQTTAQTVAQTAAVDPHPSGVDPWALAGLLLAVMGLGAIRRGQGH